MPLHFRLSEPPIAEAQIPLPPGARAVSPESVEFTWGDPEEGNTGSLYIHGRLLEVKSRYLPTYLVPMSPEEMYEFYRQRLGGQAEYGEEMEIAVLANGETSPVVSDANFHDIRNDVEPHSGRVRRSGATKRSSFSGRQPLSRDGWILDGSFEWNHCTAVGEPVVFHVLIEDRGLAEDWRSWKANTRLVIVRETYVSEDAGDADGWEEMQRWPGWGGTDLRVFP